MTRRSRVSTKLVCRERRRGPNAAARDQRAAAQRTNTVYEKANDPFPIGSRGHCMSHDAGARSCARDDCEDAITCWTPSSPPSSLRVRPSCLPSCSSFSEFAAEFSEFRRVAQLQRVRRSVPEFA